MSFKIELLDDPIPKGWILHGEKGILARITINDFKERFVLNTDCWSVEKYAQQWIDAIERLNNHPTSLLITQLYDSPHRNFSAMCWALYKKSQTVYIQNYFESPKIFGKALNLSDAYKHIREREIPDSNDEYRISEWKISLMDLKQWQATLNS